MKKFRYIFIQSKMQVGNRSDKTAQSLQKMTQKKL